MLDRTVPRMSVVIITPDTFEEMRELIGYLKAQSIVDQLELVIVAPSARELRPDGDDLTGFAHVRVVETGAFTSAESARAAGVRACIAPLVAFIEGHSFPAPQWAEKLAAAHSGPWAVVGPAIGNANPNSILSWATLLIEYGPWVGAAQAGEVDYLPGHNSAYKKEILLAQGDELEARLTSETLFHWELRAKGHRLYFEPAALTRHMNYARFSSVVRLSFFSGRQFAAARARQWPVARRLLYGVGAPLIPLVRLWRIVRQVQRTGDPYHLLPSVFPALAVESVLSALGEMAGYWFGAGMPAGVRLELEFDRRRHIV